MADTRFVLAKDDISRSQRTAWSALLLLDHFFGADRVDRRLGDAKASLQRSIARRVADRCEGRLVPVPRRRNLTPKSFRREYLRPGLPVILEGAAEGWPCMGKWSLDFLAENYGDHTSPLGDSEGLAGHGIEASRESQTLADVVSDVRSGGKSYIRFDPIVEEHAELKRDLDIAFLESLRNRLGVGAGYQCFVGGPGGTTYLHNALPANLFVMVHGEKRWQLYPTCYTAAIRPEASRGAYNYSYIDIHAPDPDVYPAFRHVDGWDVHLKPGDILYNPPWMWHEVTNLTESIGLGYRWAYLSGAVRGSPTLTLMRLAATNPPAWQPLLNLLRREQFYRHLDQTVDRKRGAALRQRRSAGTPDA